MNERKNLIPAADANGKPWPTMAEVKAKLHFEWRLAEWMARVDAAIAKAVWPKPAFVPLGNLGLVPQHYFANA